jgi:hypothetical protein
MKQVLPRRFASGVGLPTTGTRYFDIIGGRSAVTTTEASAQVVAAAAGVFRNLSARVTTAPGSGVTWTFTLRINGADTALTFTIAGTATSGSYTGGDVAVAEGDLVTLAVTVSGGTAASSGVWHTSVEFEGSTAAQSLYGSFTGGGLGTMTRYSHPWMTTLNIDATRTNVEGIAAAAGSITKLFARCTGNNVAGAETVTILVVLNGVDQDGTGGTVDTRVTLNSSTQAANLAFTLAVAAGDLIAIKSSWVSGNAGHLFSWGVQFTATTDGESQFSARPTNAPDASAVRYVPVPSDARGWNWQTSEANAAVDGGVTSFDLTALAVKTYTAPGSGKSFAFAAFVSGAASGPAVTISGTDDYEFATGSVTVAAANTVCLRATPSGTPTAGQITFAFVQYIAPPPSLELRVSQSVIEVLVEDATTIPDPSDDDGEIPTGTAPTSGNLPTGIPLLVGILEPASGDVGVAETNLPDASTYYGGRKKPWLLEVGAFRREYSGPDGGIRLSTGRARLADESGQVRTLAAAGALRQARMSFYLVDDAVRRAEGDMYRIASMAVADHAPDGAGGYELELEDLLGGRVAEWFAQPRTPGRLLSQTVFPSLDAANEGRPVPILYGAHSDDDLGASAQGMIPTVYLGTFDKSALGGSSELVDAYLVCGHAVKNITGVFFNMPDEPSTRFRVPDAYFGSLIWAPHKPNWADIFGANPVTQFIAWGGYRWTVLLLKHEIPYVDPEGQSQDFSVAAREGRSTISVNVEGVEDVGDGTGALIVRPERQLVHWLYNYIFSDAEPTGDWTTTAPTWGGYEIVDSVALAAAEAVGDAVGITVGAMAIGIDGQIDVFKQTARWLVSGDLELGSNRHGQIKIDREDPAAAAVVTYRAGGDILEPEAAGLVPMMEPGYANRLIYFWGRRWAPPAPVAAPREGDALPARAVLPYQEWRSGFQQSTADSAVTACNGRVYPRALELYGVIDEATAEAVIERILARSTGPTFNKDGARAAALRTGLQGIGKGGVSVDLGTVAAVVHPLGWPAAGWTAGSPGKLRIRAFEIDAQGGPLVTFEGRIL